MRDGRNRTRGSSGGRTAAFTLLELLVVMGIIAVLAASILVASHALIENSRARSTRAVLTIVQDALEQFKEEQSARSTLARSGAYQARYGYYPPDELEPFTAHGVPPDTGVAGPLTVGKASVVPAPSGTGVFDRAMTFQIDGLSDADRATEHRDLAAMMLAVNMFSESAAEMIGHISGSHRTTGPTSATRAPLQFLDRNGDGDFTPMEDEQIEYIVDDWGVPISYLSQRDFLSANPVGETLSSNAPAWNKASTAMVLANNGRPLVFSYGPNGPEQLEATIVTGPEPVTLVGDWADGGDQKVDHPLNLDNVYADQTFAEVLKQGVPSP